MPACPTLKGKTLFQPELLENLIFFFSNQYQGFPFTIVYLDPGPSPHGKVSITKLSENVATEVTKTWEILTGSSHLLLQSSRLSDQALGGLGNLWRK